MAEEKQAYYVCNDGGITSKSYFDTLVQARNYAVKCAFKGTKMIINKLDPKDNEYHLLERYEKCGCTEYAEYWYGKTSKPNKDRYVELG